MEENHWWIKKNTHDLEQNGVLNKIAKKMF